jgi:ribosomal protein S18 acetylase RimI-like enzyme
MRIVRAGQGGDPAIEIIEATRDDAPAIAAIHLAARANYVARVHSDDETRRWFASIVGDRPSAWWVARQNGQVVGYMLIDGENLDHLYVDPQAQGCGVGSALMHKARSLSPRRVVLVTFQRNASARAFYEKRGFLPSRFTNGENEEAEPDVHYVWEASP